MQSCGDLDVQTAQACLRAVNLMDLAVARKEVQRPLGPLANSKERSSTMPSQTLLAEKKTQLVETEEKLRNLEAKRETRLSDVRRLMELKSGGTLAADIDQSFHSILTAAKHPGTRDTENEFMTLLDSLPFKSNTLKVLVYHGAVDHVSGKTKRFDALKMKMIEDSLRAVTTDLEVAARDVDTLHTTATATRTKLSELKQEIEALELEHEKESLPAPQDPERNQQQKENEAEEDAKRSAILEDEEREERLMVRLHRSVDVNAQQEIQERQRQEAELSIAQQTHQPITGEGVSNVTYLGKGTTAVSVGELSAPPREMKESRREKDCREGKRTQAENRMGKLKQRKLRSDLDEQASDEDHDASDMSEKSADEQTQQPQPTPSTTAHSMFSWTNQIPTSLGSISSRLAKSWGAPPNNKQ